MGGISRRGFGRLAAQAGVLGISGALSSCSEPANPAAKPPGSQPNPTASSTPAPTRPIRLTQDDLDRIIGEQANALLDNLRAKAPGRNYGVAAAFAYPNHGFHPFYMYGTVADRTPPTERTIFSVGSVTKTFNAALFANGVATRPDCFDWDAGLKRYLSGYLAHRGNGEPSVVMQQVTPRMLAQHTSGLPRESTGPTDGAGLYLQDPSVVSTSLQHLWRTHDSPRPGSCWAYSNIAFVTLGFATVSAYGNAAGGKALSYPGVLRDHITGPLNMPDTFTIVPTGAQMAPAFPNGREVSSGDAADIKSSASDMHTWLLAQLGAAAGPPDLLKALKTTTAPTPLSVDICGKQKPGPANMGLAWQVESGPPQIIWKDGLTSRAGCSCWVGFTPAGPAQEPLGIAVLLNGYWNKDKPAIVADNHGAAMLKQILAAI